MLQRLFHHPVAAAPPMAAQELSGERSPQGVAIAEPADDLAGYLDVEDAQQHDPGEPPHWAPECGTPSFSTRHRCG